MATPGDLSSKKVKNTYKAIVQYSGANHQIFDGTGSRVTDLDVTRITASRLSVQNIDDLSVLQLDGNLGVSGSTKLGDNSGTDTVKIIGDTWITGSLTVSQSSTFRNIGQAKFIYKQNPEIEDQKPARVNRGMVRGKYNVPRFGGENAALDVYGNAVITGSLIVTDTVFAQEFHSETVSSSIIYTSGSTKFGGDFADTMTVTGSIFQSGSDSYFLNGIGLGTSGSQKSGVPNYNEPGQDNPVYFSHLLRIDDPGHDGLQHKDGKLIYGTFGTKPHQLGMAHVSASDTVRFRDSAKAEDVLVISSISQSVFITNESDIYNVAIGAPSRSLKIDEKLVVSSSKDTRVKIESGTGATSASLYLESGKGVWELSVASESIGASNHLSESLVFRTRNSRDIKNTFGANSTYTEALRLNNRGRAGFNIPSANLYDYPQQVQISGSLNIIQGRTIDINAGTFHNKDGINGIYFNNQKMIYVSGSAGATSMFLGVSAGGQNAATGGESNLGIGYQTAFALTTGDFNTLIGFNAGKALQNGSANIFLGSSAGLKTIDGEVNIAIGSNAFYNSTGTADYNIAVGYNAIGLGDVSGAENIGMGRQVLYDLTSGAANIAIGSFAAENLTAASNTIAIGNSALGAGILTGANNIGIGFRAGGALIDGLENVLIGSNVGLEMTDNQYNVAIGYHTLMASAANAHRNVAIGYEVMSVNDASGDANVVIGDNAGKNMTSGGANVLLGRLAGGGGNLTGGYNVAIGNQAAQNITSMGSSVFLGLYAGHNLTVGNRNIAIGPYSLFTSTANSIENNIAIGNSALRAGNVSGDRNIGLGTSTLYDLTSGTDNIAVGVTAAYNLTTGVGNIAIGSGSMALAAVTAHDNIAIGNRAMEDVTSGGGNIAIGSGSAANITTNIKNIAIGESAFAGSINDGDTNIAIGYQAIKTGDVSGDNNTGVGSQTLKNLTSGQSNLAIGSGSMGLGTVTGNDNVAVGNFALEDITSGGNNIALGSGSLASATDNIGNVAIGFEALKTSANDGDRNIAIGYQTIKTGDVSGVDNVAIGTNALDDLTTGADNVAIGAGTGLNLTTAANTIAIGHDAIGLGITTGTNNTAIGQDSGKALTAGLENIFIGSMAGTAATDNENNIAIGHDAFAASANDGDNNIAIGLSAMKTGDVSGLDNIAIGQLALEDLSSGNLNIAIGKQAMLQATDNLYNVAIGYRAMRDSDGAGDKNVIIGFQAAYQGDISGNDNVAIGSQALQQLSTGASNVAIGNSAALNLTSATNTVAIGYESGYNITTGINNVFIGKKSGTGGIVTGHNNIGLGVSSSANLTSGYDNIMIGVSAGAAATTNANNILIGSGSDAPAGVNNAYALGTLTEVTQNDSLVLGGQTGARFRVGIGGMTAPNSTLEVSGTLSVTGSALFSGSSAVGAQSGHNEGWTLKTVGTTIMSGTRSPDGRYPSMRALEVSGTANFHGNTYITGNLFVSDIIVAQEFHTEFVSASIVFTSGSSKQGDSSDDIQQMSGSFRISGSGPHYFMGRQRAGIVMPGPNGDEQAIVGINTMLPTYELDVVGNIGIGSGSAQNDSNARAAFSHIYHNDDEDTYLRLSTNRLELSAGGYTVAITGSEGANDPNTFVVNEGGKNLDFRVEGINHTHLLFVSGGSHHSSGYGGEGKGAVGIKTSNPTKALTVSGSISASKDLFIQGNATFGTATVIISGSGRITASNNIWIDNAAGYVSASGISASSGITTGGDILPYNNDGGTLGSTVKQWSDLFLAQDAVINFDNGDATISHTAPDLINIEGANTRVERLEIQNSSGYITATAQDMIIVSQADVFINPTGGDVTIDGNLKTHADSTDSIGATGVAWAKLFVDDIDLDGQGRIDLDADADTSIRASADDIISFEAAGADQLHISDEALYPETTNEFNLGDGTLGGPKFFKNAYINNITGSSISASKMIFTQGTVSASIVSASTGHFSNLTVTGSATSTSPQGTGSFGYIQADTVVIHQHEVVGGQGLSVSGSITNLGTPGFNNQPVVITGNVTASNLWVSGSTFAAGGGGHISASSLTLTSTFTTLGNISGSWISASKGLWTGAKVIAAEAVISGPISGQHITASGNIKAAGDISASGTLFGNAISIVNISGSRISASRGIFTNNSITASRDIQAGGQISASGAIYALSATVAGPISGSYISASLGLFTNNSISASRDIQAGGQISASGILYGAQAIIAGPITGSYISASKSIFTNNSISASRDIQAGGNISASGNLTAASITSSGTISGSSLISSGNIISSGSIIGTNYRSFYVAAAGMTPSVTYGPSAATIERPGVATGGETYHTIDYLAFDASTPEYANFQIKMPNEWDRGVLKAKFYWHSADDGTANETVSWGANAGVLNDGDSLSTAQGSYNSVIDVVPQDDAILNISPATNEITVTDAATSSENGLVLFRVGRMATGDTYDNDAHLLGVAFQYKERAHAEVVW